MQFTFVLVEPAVAENVGSSARALKTMGFEKLVIVNSHVHQQPEASWLAHGSADILNKIEEFDTLGAAIRDMDLVIGTTAKKRRVYEDYYTCNEIPEILDSKANMLENVAVVFGREESGLTNEELKLCHIFTGIPMKTTYPSLNLAQSVMIYAWELSQYGNASPKSTMANGRTGLLSTVPDDHDNTAKGSPSRNHDPQLSKHPANTPSAAKFRHLRKLAGDILIRIGFNRESAVYPRIMERLEAMGDKDAGLIMSVCSKIDDILNRGKA
ncbi:MAG: tRNA/rRNA methyltransferase [Bacteroidales bacterium]